MTYRNLSLYKNGTQTHPIFFGPSFIHLKKDYSSYYSFAQELIKYDHLNYKNTGLSIQNLQLIVTDDDPAIHSAFKECFPKTSFMLCCNHIKMNILNELEDYEIDEEEKEIIINKIFGRLTDRSDCLISSNDEKEFENRANDLLETMENYPSKTVLNKTFKDYFEEKAQKIYASVVEPSLKFRNDLNPYQTTNDVESSHTCVKSRKEHRKKGLKKFKFIT